MAWSCHSEITISILQYKLRKMGNKIYYNFLIELNTRHLNCASTYVVNVD